MAPKFGTSGLRGLVSELTADLVAAHVRAFARACPVGAGLCIGRDLRPSSSAIAAEVALAAQAMGLQVTDCGAVPTPALALAAMSAGAAAIMVTGSHIPADRNGLKFYTPAGEITRTDEAAILAGLAADKAPSGPPGPAVRPDDRAGPAYVARHLTAFGPQSLSGLRLGIYAHSAVGRDLLTEVLTALGADVAELGRSDVFIPVDTEAVDSATRARLHGWAATGRLDAILSTDGDGDRPLLTDASGEVIAGDVLGQIAAAALAADVVVTPVSANTGAEASGRFARVLRCRIGSPHVIAGMEAVLRGTPAARVVGYEANGGFLLGFDAHGPLGPLPALMTRDSLLPMISALVAARAHAASGDRLAALVAAEPPRVTATDRLQGIPTAQALALIARLEGDPSARAAFLAAVLAPATALPGLRIDRTDGLRILLTQEGADRIVHLRPSGNAPELRLYIEAESSAVARRLLAQGLAALRSALAG